MVFDLIFFRKVGHLVLSALTSGARGFGFKPCAWQVEEGLVSSCFLSYHFILHELHEHSALSLDWVFNCAGTVIPSAGLI